MHDDLNDVLDLCHDGEFVTTAEIRTETRVFVRVLLTILVVEDAEIFVVKTKMVELPIRRSSRQQNTLHQRFNWRFLVVFALCQVKNRRATVGDRFFLGQRQGQVIRRVPMPVNPTF